MLSSKTPSCHLAHVRVIAVAHGIHQEYLKVVALSNIGRSLGVSPVIVQGARLSPIARDASLYRVLGQRESQFPRYAAIGHELNK
jgi:hypothetical protein